MIIECFAVIKSSATVADSVALDYEQRQKSRGKTKTDNGQDLAWFLPRANVLADGDCLQANDGTLIKVKAAVETLSEVKCDNALQLTKAAYHLGNRHVPLQIDANCLSYQHDHVLDAMIEGLGLRVVCVQKPFHPESGAYHNHSSSDEYNPHSHHHEH